MVSSSCNLAMPEERTRPMTGVTFGYSTGSKLSAPTRKSRFASRRRKKNPYGAQRFAL